MKVYILPALLFALSACTPDIEHAVNKTQRDVETYDYAHPIRKTFGINEISPDRSEKRAEVLKNSCLHEKAQNRVLSTNGVETQHPYVECPLSIAPEFSRPEHIYE